MSKNSSEKSAVVLLSGGLDSTVCLWWVNKQHYTRVDCLTFEYGSKEEVVLKQVTKRLGILAKVDHHEFVSLEFLANFSKRAGSSLAQGSANELPKLSEKELDDFTASIASAKSVWIPARNLVFLSIAAAYSEILGNDVDIITGFNLEEGTTFPDNTKEFIDDFTKTAERGVLNARVKIISPLVGMTKTEIVLLGKELSVPFNFSNSCYNPQGFNKDQYPIHCGECESCLRRKRGFIEGLEKDPTIYASKENQ
ncbi:MAG: 7-cyano-7-deazaguanine synthase QueC [Asgard group archaeon]|nr:7-cyano-7-deazaguanine synthase QueC [Asgard group archaeon]